MIICFMGFKSEILNLRTKKLILIHLSGVIFSIHPPAIFVLLQHLIDIGEGLSGNGHSGFAGSFRSSFALIELEQILAGIVDVPQTLQQQAYR